MQSSGAAARLPQTGKHATPCRWHSMCESISSVMTSTLHRWFLRWLLEDRSRSTRENALFSVGIMARHRSPYLLILCICLASPAAAPQFSRCASAPADGEQRWW